MFKDLLVHQDNDKLSEFSATALALLQSLGFLINYPKPVREPTQTLVFLGFIINSKEWSLPAEKVVVEAKAIWSATESQPDHLPNSMGG